MDGLKLQKSCDLAVRLGIELGLEPDQGVLPKPTKL